MQLYVGNDILDINIEAALYIGTPSIASINLTMIKIRFSKPQSI